MKTYKRVHAVIRIDKNQEIEVVEVLLDLSVANDLVSVLQSEDSTKTYVVRESKIRWREKSNILLAEAKRIIINEWDKRPPCQRTENDIFTFFGEIYSTMPELLTFRSKIDRWQKIHGWLIQHENNK
jgi:hypothetical protein